jgi:Holliday junction resolvase RusA-like endonuclease
VRCAIEVHVNTCEVIIVDGLPPTTNHGYRISTRNGKAIIYKAPEVKAWQEQVQWRIKEQRLQPLQEWKGKAIYVTFHMFMKDRRMDVDGGVKYTLDAAAKGFGFNDKMVDKIMVERTLDAGLVESTAIYVMEMPTCQE